MRRGASWLHRMLCACAAAGSPIAAQAGGIGVREQSTYFLGSAFAGSAAGSDISSIFWNSAATASRAGCNFSSNLTVGFGHAEETAQAGLFVSGLPPVAPGLTPTSTDVARAGYVPASYATCQVSKDLFVGLGINAPFGFTTKPGNTAWGGSPIAITSKIFTFDINPTLAYKVTPELTVGAGVQIEYFSARLSHGAFNSLGGPLVGARSYDANDWGLGVTVGAIWQPSPATSIGLGYRSAVRVEVDGQYAKGAGLFSGPAIATNAAAGLTLPDEVTLSARQRITRELTLLGTVEWQNWSRIQNVSAVGTGCGAASICEALNLNYRDGWLYSLGAEYAYSPSLTLRTGVGYESSPIQDSTRDILLPDSNRILLNLGASYRYSSQLTFDVGYEHLFFDGGSFCIANAALNGGTSHCNAGTPAAAVLLSGKTETSVDVLSLGMKYRF